MKKIFLIFTFVLIQITSISVEAQHRMFIFGVNGHPLTQESYYNSIGLQINLLKEAGIGTYRIDLPMDSKGNVANEKRFRELLNIFSKNSVKVLPVLLFDKSIYQIASGDEAYKNGVEYGTNFVKSYKDIFDDYEIGNEEANNIILSAEVDGDRVQHYDSSKALKGMMYFKGVCEAIKEQDKGAKIIINEGWVHYGFFELLHQYGVKYDIIGYHAYSDMGDITNARKGFGNVLDTLSKKFNKKIWVTEMNVKNGTLQKYSADGVKWFSRNLRLLYRNKNVGGLFVYELLDQPTFDNKTSPYSNPSEAYYGLASWKVKYTAPAKKPIFYIYKSFIQIHNMK